MKGDADPCQRSQSAANILPKQRVTARAHRPDTLGTFCLTGTAGSCLHNPWTISYPTPETTTSIKDDFQHHNSARNRVPADITTRLGPPWQAPKPSRLPHSLEMVVRGIDVSTNPLPTSSCWGHIKLTKLTSSEISHFPVCWP